MGALSGAQLLLAGSWGQWALRCYSMAPWGWRSLYVFSVGALVCAHSAVTDADGHLS
jgi:hypothetical protein